MKIIIIIIIIIVIIMIVIIIQVKPVFTVDDLVTGILAQNFKGWYKKPGRIKNTCAVQDAFCSQADIWF